MRKFKLYCVKYKYWFCIIYWTCFKCTTFTFIRKVNFQFQFHFLYRLYTWHTLKKSKGFFYRDLSDEKSSENRFDRLQCRHDISPNQPNAQYRRLANNYLISPPSTPIAPVAQRVSTSRRSSTPPLRFAYLYLCEEILIWTRGTEEQRGILPSLDFRWKIYRSVGPSSRRATKVSVRSRLTVNFGTSKSDFPHAWASRSRATTRSEGARGTPRVGATCRHVWVSRVTLHNRRSVATSTPPCYSRIPYCLPPLSLSLSLSLSLLSLSPFPSNSIR